jgi:hypothetical protein
VTLDAIQLGPVGLVGTPEPEMVESDRPATGLGQRADEVPAMKFLYR